ncbi:MAG TPA: SHOCT domain-containing protein [Clostridia bacterium]|nr:SHOCT domain-containing protein [Clostridia bacterium]
MMAFARYGGYGRGMMWGGGHILMGLFCLVLFVALILWIIRMVSWRRHGMSCGMHGMYMHGMHDSRDMMQGRPDEALDILRKRFASGDMTKEDYDERLKVLNGEKQP